MEEAHARVCAGRRWVLNEKRRVEAAGLANAHTWFSNVPSTTDGLLAWVAEVRDGLAH